MVNISIRRIIAGFSLMILLTVNYGCSNENAHDIPTSPETPEVPWNGWTIHTTKNGFKLSDTESYPDEFAEGDKIGIFALTTEDGSITSNPQLSSSASFLRLNVLSSLN